MEKKVVVALGSLQLGVSIAVLVVLLYPLMKSEEDVAQLRRAVYGLLKPQREPPNAFSWQFTHPEMVSVSVRTPDVVRIATDSVRVTLASDELVVDILQDLMSGCQPGSFSEVHTNGTIRLMRLFYLSCTELADFTTQFNQIHQ
jgi:hypothetical protein